MAKPKTPSANAFLRLLPLEIRKLVDPHLVQLELGQSATLHEAGDLIETIYFLNRGLVSLVATLQSGHSVEIAMIGNDGIIGGTGALGDTIATARAVVQIGGSAVAIRANILRGIAASQPTLTEAISRYDQLTVMQTVQSAACISVHKVEARLARWLLRCRDLIGSDDLQLTQEFLGDMLGVRRASVSSVASSLQDVGLIEYSRGRVKIKNVRGLRAAACECYGTVVEVAARIRK